MPLEYDGNLLKTLIGSLAFQMSLGSKELFHSNILAYAISRQPSLMSRIFGIDGRLVEVAREQHLGKNAVVDMCIEAVANDGRRNRLVIENKFKSLPSVDQLARYENSEQVKKWQSKGDTVKFFLISPLSPIEIPKDWVPVRYETIFAALIELEYPPNDVYELGFFKDYATSFGQVINLLRTIHDAVARRAEDNSWTDVVQLASHQDFEKRNLRIYDLLHKVAFEALASEVKARIKDKKNFSFATGWTAKVEVALAPKSKQGLLDVCFIHATGSKIGIQIEGANYRHFVVAAAPRGALTDTPAEWLTQPVAIASGQPIALSGLTRRSLNGARGDPRSYNLTGERRFLYQDAHLGADISVSNLIKTVVTDFEALSAKLSEMRLPAV
jgi:hypothetical protein